MKYFNYFPAVEYKFGNEEEPDIFRNISVYAEVIDAVSNNSSFYNDYYIQEFERPDQISFKLYRTPNYYWTFFLMNAHIREQGWPLTNRELVEKAQLDYKDKTITTKTLLTDKFKVGETITGNTSGATATVGHRHLDLGQIVLTNVTGTFVSGEVVTSELNKIITVTSYENEYESAHHYENSSGEYVDIDPSVGPGAFDIEVTYLDRLVKVNDSLKSIRVIKPSSINSIVNAFREAVRGE